MSCLLFTYHGHATWMPDDPRGYVHRTRGLQPSDPSMADAYRRRQRRPTVLFDPAMQELIVGAANTAGSYLDATVHAVATEPTHVHVLISWRHGREWKSIRASIRSAVSRALNERFGKRDWFADSPSRKRARDYEHFDYLMLAYLPKHGGACLFREASVRESEARDRQRPVSVKHRRLRRKKK